MLKKKKFTTQEVVEKLTNGEDVGTITAYLYGRFREKSIRLVQRLGGTYEDSEDVLHDSLLALLHHIQKGEFKADGVATLDTYFYRIVSNKWMNQDRGNKRRWERERIATEMTGIIDNNTPLSEVIQEDTAYHVFKRIGDRCKKILTAYYLEKRSLNEIAEELQLLPGTLRVEKYRCMQKISSLAKDLL